MAPGPGPGAGTVLWPYTQPLRRPWRRADPRYLDPVNGMVIGAPPGRIAAALDREGWHRPDGGARHRTWVNGRSRLMSDHRARGDASDRLHVRMFGLAHVTLLAAHDEVLVGRRHVVRSWDTAREQVVAALARQGFATLAPSAVVARADLRGVAGDGRVWRLVGP